MMKIKNKKKGFSLVELLITITILGILTAVFVPSFNASTSASKEKADESAIENLQLNIQLGAQEVSVYKDAVKLVENAADKKITFVYIVNEDMMLECNYCQVKDIDGGIVKDTTGGEVGDNLLKIKERILEYVNGKVEPITIQSEFYRTQQVEISLLFPNVEFKVNTDKELKPR